MTENRSPPQQSPEPMRPSDIRNADDLNRFLEQCYSSVWSRAGSDSVSPAGASVDSAGEADEQAAAAEAERRREQREFARKELEALERELEEERNRDWESEP